MPTTRTLATRRLQRVLAAVLIWTLAALPAAAQSQLGDADALLEELVRAGFESPRVRVHGDTLLLAFEYRMGRGSHAGVCRALDLAGGGYSRIVAVLEHQEVAMAALRLEGPAVTARTAAMHAPIGGSTLRCGGYRATGATDDVRRFVHLLEDGRGERTRVIDLSIHPRYSALFGFYRDPVMLQVNAAPRMNVRLWRGFEIGAQVVLPLYNEFSSEGDYVRPGLLTASQVVRLPGPTIVRLTAGSFTNRRFGFDLRARRAFDGGRYSAGLEIGRTVNLYYPNGSLFIDGGPEWVVLATAGVAWPRYNLFVDGAGGRFLFGDAGGRVRVMRQFGRTDVGFEFTQTANGANAGLRLVLPLFEGLHAGGRSVRIRPASDFTWDYMYRAGANVGEHYDTGYFMDRAYRQHHPDYLLHLVGTP